jgi:hypothetical protein
LNFGIEPRDDDVAVSPGFACCQGFEREDLLAGLNDSLGEKKSSGEIEILAGSSHGDRERSLADANFERLLARKGILHAARAPFGPLGNLGQVNASRRQGQLLQNRAIQIIRLRRAIRTQRLILAQLLARFRPRSFHRRERRDARQRIAAISSQPPMPAI